jgi:hypothetical protein
LKQALISDIYVFLLALHVPINHTWHLMLFFFFGGIGD